MGFGLNFSTRGTHAILWRRLLCPAGDRLRVGIAFRPLAAHDPQHPSRGGAVAWNCNDHDGLVEMDQESKVGRCSPLASKSWTVGGCGKHGCRCDSSWLVTLHDVLSVYSRWCATPDDRCTVDDIGMFSIFRLWICRWSTRPSSQSIRNGTGRPNHRLNRPIHSHGSSLRGEPLKVRAMGRTAGH